MLREDGKGSEPGEMTYNGRKNKQKQNVNSFKFMTTKSFCMDKKKAAKSNDYVKTRLASMDIKSDVAPNLDNQLCLCNSVMLFEVKWISHSCPTLCYVETPAPPTTDGEASAQGDGQLTR